MRPSDWFTIPLDDWVEVLVKDWLVPNFRPFFQAIQLPVDKTLIWLESFLHSVPVLLFVVVAAFIAWRTAGRGVAIFALIALLFLDFIKVWPETMTTLAMIVTAVLFCAIVGVPVGIAAARSDRFATVVRPILDIMQTIDASGRPRPACYPDCWQ